jgi:hypothetical protein
MWMCLGVVLGTAVPVVLGCIEYRIERGMNIVLSPREWIANPQWPEAKPFYRVGDKLVDFVPRMQQYTKTAEIVITLSSASIIFIPSHVTKQPILALSMILLGFAVVWGVCFIAWMSYCYEQALYDPASFGIGRSAVMFGSGFGGLFCFAVAYLVLAFVVAHAIAHGQTLT